MEKLKQKAGRELGERQPWPSQHIQAAGDPLRPDRRSREEVLDYLTADQPLLVQTGPLHTSGFNPGASQGGVTPPDQLGGVQRSWPDPSTPRRHRPTPPPPLPQHWRHLSSLSASFRAVNEMLLLPPGCGPSIPAESLVTARPHRGGTGVQGDASPSSEGDNCPVMATWIPQQQQRGRSGSRQQEPGLQC